jgi:CelD/BcsL family acetyltransferase involved in cellulose biosynthesis
VLDVRTLTATRDWEALGGGWDDLLATAAAPSPFLCWDWLRTWWEVFGAGRGLRVLVAQEEGRPRALWPLMRARVGGRLARRWRRLLTIGQQGETQAEALDLIAPAGTEEAAARAFAAHLCGPRAADWDALLLERVPADSAALAALRRALAEHGRPAAPCAPVSAPWLRLPSTWETFLAGRSRNFVRQLRQARNRLARAGAVRIRRVGEDLEPEEGMDALARLHRARWGERSESFRSAGYLRFHRLLAGRMHARGHLYLALLEVGGEAVAARYDYLFAGRMWCMQGGWLPDWADRRPGTVLTADAVAWGIDHGYEAYDFLSGDEPYKRRWADGERVFTDLVAANTATLRGRLYARHLALRALRGAGA